MADGLEHARSGPSSLARRLIEWWALAGGAVLLGVAVMTTWSAVSGWLLGKPMPGDFELTEILVAVAVFAFLPYCQQSGANVTADLFTAGAGPRAVAGFRLFGALLSLAVAVLLAWRTWAGLLDYRQYVETTAILKIPIWWAYVPAFASLLLLIVACLIVLAGCWREMLRG
jgi:TRAP-type C4-dicarboxylate transport system permease small subunit